MILTHTFLKCDGCGYQLPGCQDGHANREANTLAIARELGWRRVHGQAHLKDFCPGCTKEVSLVA
jgi:hypothetical protein